VNVPASLQRRLARRGEEGSTLAITLGVMILSIFMVLSLLGLSFAMTGLSQATANATRQARAADSAIEDVVNQIRMDPTALLGSGSAGQPCVVPGGNARTFQNDTSTAVDDVTVELSCRIPDGFAPVRVATAAAARLGPDSPPGRVQIVGDRYRGDLDVARNCSGSTPDGPGCFPWERNLWSPANRAAIAATGPTLRHTGRDALVVTSGLDVTKGAVAQRNLGVSPTLPGAPAPGIVVGGAYRQGDPGPLAGPGPACGILSPASLAKAPTGAPVRDLEGEPECSVPAATLGTGSATPATTWTAALVRDRRRSLPATCPPGPVVPIVAGAYGPAETATLNAWLSGPGSGCTSKTFWFAPGDYWFDVQNPGGPVDQRTSLRMADPTAKLVFGEPRGWLPAAGAPDAAFPEACDTTRPGVSITLSARTTLDHRAGRVAICDRGTAGIPAVSQQSAVDTGWSMRATSLAAGAGATSRSREVVYNSNWWFTGQPFILPQPVVNGPATVNAGPVGSIGSVSALCPQSGSSRTLCDTRATLPLTFGGPEPVPSPAPVTSARVLLTGRALAANAYTNLDDPANNQPGEVAVSVSLPSGGVCDARFPFVPESGSGTSETVALDLLAPPVSGFAPSASCATVITDRSTLRNASITVSLRLKAECPFASLLTSTPISCPGDAYGFGVDSVELQTSQLLTAGATSDPRIAVADGDAKRDLMVPCGTDPCPTDTTSLNVGSFTSPIGEGSGGAAAGGAPIGPTGRVLVSVRGNAVNTNGPAARTVVRFTPAGAGGPVCSVTINRLPDAAKTISSLIVNFFGFNVPVWSDPSSSSPIPGADVTQVVDLTADPGCAPLRALTRTELLDGRVDVDLVRACETGGCLLSPLNPFTGFPIWPAPPSWSEVDAVGLSVLSSDVYQGPTRPHHVTMDAANGTSFNVFGGVSMAASTLDVEWKGAATEAGILSDSSTLGAVGSDQAPGAQMGVLCCSPSTAAERSVSIEARVGGRLRARALISIGDVTVVAEPAVPPSTPAVPAGSSRPGRTLTVYDWRQCLDPACGSG